MTIRYAVLGRRTRTPPPAPARLSRRLQAVLDRLDAAAPTNIGYPTATDIDYRPLGPFLKYMINNPGDPGADPLYPAHVKDLERDVLAWFAQLLGAAPGCAGYLTGGGSEGTLYGLWLARTKHPGAVVYHSATAHDSVCKASELLGLPTVGVPAAPNGEIDYTALRHLSGFHRSRPAVVVATIGTTMAEAVDDVPRIRAELDAAGITHQWIHADAALSGVPHALTGRTDFGLTNADSITVSGHKFFGTPIACAVALARRPAQHPRPPVGYLGCRDSTITGSRSGLAALMLSHAIDQYGYDGHRRRAEQARDLAGYARDRLTAIGWPAWRNPGAVTVLLRPLPAALKRRWPLPVEQDWSHLICMPGITRRQVDDLVTDLEGVSR